MSERQPIPDLAVGEDLNPAGFGSASKPRESNFRPAKNVQVLLNHIETGGDPIFWA
jgi:hypothetical protein